MRNESAESGIAGGKMKNPLNNLSLRACRTAFFSAAFLAFGMYNIHSISGITEGGVLGAVLLIRHHFGISPAVSSLILNLLCYLLGFRTFGKTFLIYSGISALGYSIGYGLCECFPPLYPQIAEMPLAAAIAGSLFVGIGCGLCVRVGGAPSGDDALAMSLSKISGIPIQWVYLLTDLTVLTLSLTYIPLSKITYSLITVILSGQIIGWLLKNPKP